MKIIIVNQRRWLRRYSRGPKLTNKQQRTAVNRYKQTKKNKKGNICAPVVFLRTTYEVSLLPFGNLRCSKCANRLWTGHTRSLLWECRWRPVAERHGFIFSFFLEDTRETGLAYRAINQNNTYELRVFQNKMCFFLNISKTNLYLVPGKLFIFLLFSRTPISEFFFSRCVFEKLHHKNIKSGNIFQKWLIISVTISAFPSQNAITLNDLNTIDWKIFQKISVTNIARSINCFFGNKEPIRRS